MGIPGFAGHADHLEKVRNTRLSHCLAAVDHGSEDAPRDRVLTVNRLQIRIEAEGHRGESMFVARKRSHLPALVDLLYQLGRGPRANTCADHVCQGSATARTPPPLR